ncbi:MAG: HEPN domain-containing protein [Bacteroidales bacterium]|nr:HEPN domain-containing protein [Bacteroidales bacterium]
MGHEQVAMPEKIQIGILSTILPRISYYFFTRYLVMTREERIEYSMMRIESAYNTFEAAKILIKNGLWNSAFNRLYYAVFYAVNALLVLNKIDSQTYSGSRTKFSRHTVNDI